jgi:molybdate transport system ATP-binding protein
VIDASISKRFTGRNSAASFELDVQLKTGAGFAVLFGPSGAGKSLILDAIAGFVHPDKGRILVDDVLLFDAAAGVSLRPQRRRCGYVSQDAALFPNMTLEENLAFAAERLPRLERRRKVKEILAQLRLEELGGRRPHELSGGQQQRGAIARALLSQPRILLLDEPSSGLDGPLREEFYSLLREVRSTFRIPILLVTHDLDEALELGEEMFVIDGGRIIQSGPPEKVLDEPAGEATARLMGRFNVFDAEIASMDPTGNRSKLIIQLEPGRSMEMDGPYFPGHLLGARIRLGIRAEAVRVMPHSGFGEPLKLLRASQRAQTVRLELEGGFVAEMTQRSFASCQGHSGEWVMQFPAEALRLLR